MNGVLCNLLALVVVYGRSINTMADIDDLYAEFDELLEGEVSAEVLEAVDLAEQAAFNIQ